MAKVIPSILALLVSAAVAQVPHVDWKKYNEETLRHYRALLQIDTSNPPGNETKAVDYLKKVLEADGIPLKIFALEADRANLVARIKGNGKKRPILVMGHTDVVGVQREKWPVDPFGAVLKDSYIWGRGAVDNKNSVVANLMLMLVLKRLNVPLDRDVIFLAEAGEEGNSPAGINYMVREHFGEIDAEYAIAEGGDITLENGREKVVGIVTTEKIPRGVRLIANGTSGHGSRPRTDNAVVHLATAVGKVGTWQTPMRLNDTTRAYFERLATISTPEQAARYNGLTHPEKSAAIQTYLAEHEPRHYSMLRTSVVPTILKAGFRLNVIPSEAEATVDIRALPDEDIARFYEEMRRVINDPAVKIVPSANPRPAAPPSRLDTEMFAALERVAKRLYPGSTTMPTMLTGATDMAQLRSKGMQCYGIGPAATEQDRINYGAHSDVERLLEASIYKFVEFTWHAVLEVAGAK